uniref:Uncharacterized protein n=1 Tax=Klebsiella pneumoniae TaxID=573 RepID=A0A8E6NU69_KLEPN|nr:hypothetical protein [Klebsiella pneumoniae]
MRDSRHFNGSIQPINIALDINRCDGEGGQTVPGAPCRPDTRDP